MGCAASKAGKEEEMAVRRCKERKRLMKQLVGYREEFAAAQVWYLRSLRNTGATLGQFADLDHHHHHHHMSSPPPALPPPPPPPFAPDDDDVPEVAAAAAAAAAQEDCIELDGEGDNACTPPPPPERGFSWDFWDPFGPPPPPPPPPDQDEDRGPEEEEEEENWADTKTEFGEEEEEEDETRKSAGTMVEREVAVAVDDCSSMVSKDTDTAMAVWSSNKTLAGIMKELDHYFLEASSGIHGVAILLENNGVSQRYHGVARDCSRSKGGKSAKVFNALSWSWSSRSLQSPKDLEELHGSGDTCKPGAHCRTLDKLHSEEQKLYEKVKEEGITRSQYQQKFLLLQKQEAENHDAVKTDKTRSSVEILQSDLCCLQQSIAMLCSSILKLRDEELEPQLIELTSGLMHMWRTMYDCHQVQNHIALQINSVSNHISCEPVSAYRIKATLQLENETVAWYNSYCNLLRSQRNYVHSLNHWVQLTDYLPDNQFKKSSSAIRSLCEEWQRSLDILPEKVASDAITSFISVIKSIAQQQAEERKLQRRAERLERMLEKELSLLSKMENKFNEVDPSNDLASGMSPAHPLSVRRSKIDALRKKVEGEKAKYVSFMQTTRGMTLSNLITCLPNVFRAMTGFSNVYARALEGVYRSVQETEVEEVS